MCASGAVSGGGTLTVPLSAVPANATAVVVNVTATDTAGSGYLSAYPTGTTPSAPTSVVNYTAGQTVANQATVEVGTTTPTGGTATPSITIANGPSTTGNVDVVVDLQGYYAPASSTNGNAGEYTALTPARIADTRCFPSTQSFCSAENIPPANQNTSTLTAGGTQTIQATGVGGVPTSGVSAVVVDVTEVNATAPSFFTVFGAGQTQPSSSNLNFTAGEVLSAKAIVPVSSSGQISIFNHAGTADAVVDVEGYFSAATGPLGALFTPVAPTRIIGTTTTPVTVAAGASTTATVIGSNGVPAGSTAAAINLTDVMPSKGNFLTAYPSDQKAPVASDVNWIPANTYNVVPNAAYATLSTTQGANGTAIGSFSVLNGPADTNNNAGSTGVIADLFGYFTPTTQTGVLVTATPSTVSANTSTTATPSAGSTSQISATVHNANGQTVSGDSVLFSVSPTTGCGTFTANPVATGSNGVATTTYTAPAYSTTSGAYSANCVITAQEANNGLSGSTTVAQSTPANSVVVTASPSSVPANGTSPSALSATVSNAGNPAASNNVTVTFTTSGGAACGTITPTGTGTTGATNSTTPVPVTATYKTSTTAGFCTITAKDSTGAVGTTPIDQTAYPAITNATVTVAAAPGSTLSPTYGGTSNLVATVVTSGTTNPIPNDPVVFVVTGGTSTTSCGTVSPATGTTNASGQVTTVYTASTIGATNPAVTCTVTAMEADTAQSGSATVTQAPNPTYSTTTTTSNANNNVPIGTSTTVTDTVNGLPAGTTGTVTFSIPETGGAVAASCGTFPGGTIDTTTGTYNSPAIALTNGAASTTYTASNTSGFCTVTGNVNSLSNGSSATASSVTIDQS